MPDEDDNMDMEGYEDFSDDPGSTIDYAEAELLESVQHRCPVCATLLTSHADIASCKNC